MKIEVDDMIITHEGDYLLVLGVNGDILKVWNNVNDYEIKISEVKEVIGYN